MKTQEDSTLLLITNLLKLTSVFEAKWFINFDLFLDTVPKKDKIKYWRTIISMYDWWMKKLFNSCIKKDLFFFVLLDHDNLYKLYEYCSNQVSSSLVLAYKFFLLNSDYFLFLPLVLSSKSFPQYILFLCMTNSLQRNLPYHHQ